MGSQVLAISDILLGQTGGKSSVRPLSHNTEKIYLDSGLRVFGNSFEHVDPLCTGINFKTMNNSITVFECNYELVAQTFVPIYKLVNRRSTNSGLWNLVYLWRNEGTAYYIGKDCIFNRSKRPLMLLETIYFEGGSKHMLLLDKTCYDSTRKLEKLLSTAFVQAFHISFRDGIVVVDDLSNMVYGHFEKHYEYNALNESLNKKLHDFAKNYELV